MEKLNTLITSEPGKPKQAWAEQFGISRPYLYALADGSRLPSLAVAMRIQEKSGGAIPLSAWPNLKTLIDATRGM